MNVFDAANFAFGLRTIHGTAKALYGDAFEEKVARWEPILRDRAKEKHEGNLLAAATEIAKGEEITPQWRLIIFAVYVELTDRDAAKKQTPIVVYRVQDGEGRGPFKPGVSHLWLDDDPRESERPSIMAECGFGVFSKILTGESAGCAFRTLAELKRWFSATELRRLEHLGYHVVELTADRIIAATPTQLLIGRAKPLSVGVRRITIEELRTAA